MKLTLNDFEAIIEIERRTKIMFKMNVKKNTPNLPSKTGNKSGKRRGNNPPKNK